MPPGDKDEGLESRGSWASAATQGRNGRMQGKCPCVSRQNRPTILPSSPTSIALAGRHFGQTCMAGDVAADHDDELPHLPDRTTDGDDVV